MSQVVDADQDAGSCRPANGATCINTKTYVILQSTVTEMQSTAKTALILANADVQTGTRCIHVSNAILNADGQHTSLDCHLGNCLQATCGRVTGKMGKVQPDQFRCRLCQAHPPAEQQ